MTAIDLGSRKAVLGDYRESVNQHLSAGVEIIGNAWGQKETDVCIAWIRDKERLYGRPATQQMFRNMEQTFTFPTRLIGLTKQDQEQIAREQKFCSFKIEEEAGANGRLYAQVGTQKLVMEQIMAAFLKKMLTVFEKQGDSEERKLNEQKEIFITYPSFASKSQRQALHNACIIADIRKPKLVCESTAIVVSYASNNMNTLQLLDQPKIVAFVDIGNSKSTITIAQYEKNGAQVDASVVFHNSNQNLGGRDLDWQIFEMINQEFIEQHSENLKEKKKMIFKMLECIEKARKNLSMDNEAAMSIDSFLNGEDYERQLFEDEFNVAIQPQIQQLKTLLDDTIENLQNEYGISVDQISIVELLGDASRTPIFKDAIQSAFQVDNLRRTMHSSEFMARGAATLASQRSKKIIFKQFPCVVTEYEERPRTIDSQEQQMQKYKQNEDAMTEYDRTIKNVMAFKYEREKEGGWPVIQREWNGFINTIKERDFEIQALKKSAQQAEETRAQQVKDQNQNIQQMNDKNAEQVQGLEQNLLMSKNEHDKKTRELNQNHDKEKEKSRQQMKTVEESLEESRKGEKSLNDKIEALKQNHEQSTKENKAHTDKIANEAKKFFEDQILGLKKEIESQKKSSEMAEAQHDTQVLALQSSVSQVGGSLSVQKLLLSTEIYALKLNLKISKGQAENKINDQVELLKQKELEHKTQIESMEQSLLKVEEKHAQQVQDLQKNIEQMEEQNAAQVKAHDSSLYQLKESHESEMENFKTSQSLEEERHAKQLRELQENIESMKEEHGTKVQGIKQNLLDAKSEHKQNLLDAKSEHETNTQTLVSSHKQDSDKKEEELQTIQKSLKKAQESLTTDTLKLNFEIETLKQTHQESKEGFESQNKVLNAQIQALEKSQQLAEQKHKTEVSDFIQRAVKEKESSDAQTLALKEEMDDQKKGANLKKAQLNAQILSLQSSVNQVGGSLSIQKLLLSTEIYAMKLNLKVSKSQAEDKLNQQTQDLKSVAEQVKEEHVQQVSDLHKIIEQKTQQNTTQAKAHELSLKQSQESHESEIESFKTKQTQEEEKHVQQLKELKEENIQQMEKQNASQVQANQQNLKETKSEYDNKTQALELKHKKVEEKNEKDKKTLEQLLEKTKEAKESLNNQTLTLNSEIESLKQTQQQSKESFESQIYVQNANIEALEQSLNQAQLQHEAQISEQHENAVKAKNSSDAQTLALEQEKEAQKKSAEQTEANHKAQIFALESSVKQVEGSLNFQTLALRIEIYALQLVNKINQGKAETKINQKTLAHKKSAEQAEETRAQQEKDLKKSLQHEQELRTQENQALQLSLDKAKETHSSETQVHKSEIEGHKKSLKEKDQQIEDSSKKTQTMAIKMLDAGKKCGFNEEQKDEDSDLLSRMVTYFSDMAQPKYLTWSIKDGGLEQQIISYSRLSGASHLTQDLNLVDYITCQVGEDELFQASKFYQNFRLLKKDEQDQFISQDIAHFADNNFKLSHPSICNSVQSVFLTGGFIEEDVQQDQTIPKTFQSACFRYDLIKSTWQQMPSMKQDKNKHSSCYLGGFLYVFCGSTTNNTNQRESTTNEVERIAIFDNLDEQQSQEWEVIPQECLQTLPKLSQFFSIALNEEEILIMGGRGMKAGKINIFNTSSKECSTIDVSSPFKFFNNSEGNYSVAQFSENKIAALVFNSSERIPQVIEYVKGQSQFTIRSVK